VRLEHLHDRRHQHRVIIRFGDASLADKGEDVVRKTRQMLDHRVARSYLALLFATGRLARSRDRSRIFNDKNVRLWAGKSQTGICNARQQLSERLGLSRWDICEIGHVK
jgi:hypothetical protein